MLEDMTGFFNSLLGAMQKWDQEALFSVVLQFNYFKRKKKRIKYLK